MAEYLVPPFKSGRRPHISYFNNKMDALSVNYDKMTINLIIRGGPKQRHMGAVTPIGLWCTSKTYIKLWIHFQK